MGLLHRKKAQGAPAERLDPLGFPEPPKNVRPAGWQPATPGQWTAPARLPPAPPAPSAAQWRPPAPPARPSAPVQGWDQPEQALPARRPAPPAAQEWPEEQEWEEPAAPSRGAPLFIKIDRYRDVVRDVQRLKSASAGLRDALDAMAELQRELQASTTVIAKALDKFNSTLTGLDAKFVRVGGVETEPAPPEPIHQELRSQVTDLHAQMQRLRTELKDLE